MTIDSVDLIYTVYCTVYVHLNRQSFESVEIMNTRNNLRFQETEQRIRTAFKDLCETKPTDKVTVSDICKAAKIHRTTFYGHYTDIPALYQTITEELMEEFFRSFSPEGNWNLKEGLLSQLSFFYRNRHIIQRHIRQASGTHALLQFYQSHRLSESSKQSYMTHYHCRSEEELQYHQSFLTTGMSAMIQRWIVLDCPESPQQMAELLARFLFPA